MLKRRDENETAFDAKRDVIIIDPKIKPDKMAVRVKAGHKGGKTSGKKTAAR